MFPVLGTLIENPVHYGLISLQLNLRDRGRLMMKLLLLLLLLLAHVLPPSLSLHPLRPMLATES
jgi:hypothetical protein